MPLTSEQKRRFLQRIGKNPDEFDYDESTGRVIPLQKEQPTTAPITTPPTTARPVSGNDPGAVGVFGRSFARGAIPSAAGLVGGSLLAAPFTGGGSLLLPLGAGLVGGIGSSYLAGEVQEKALQRYAPGVQQYLNEGAEQHPLASTLGGVASGIVGMKPSIQNIRTAGRGIRNLLTGVETSAAQKGATLNVGLGAGIGAGQSVYEDVRQGEEIDLVKAILSATGGGLLSEPNRIGRALGVAPSTQDAPAITGVSERRIGASPAVTRPSVAARSTVSPVSESPRFTPEGQTMRQRMLADEAQLARESELAAETGYDPATGKRIEELASEGDPFMVEQRRKNAELKMQLRIARAQKQSAAEAQVLAKQLAKEREELAAQRAQAAQDEQLALASEATTAAQINTPAREFGVAQRADDPIGRFREGYEVTEQRLARERGRTRTPERTTAKAIEFTPEQRAVEFTRPLEELPTKPYDINAPKRETTQPKEAPKPPEVKVGFKVPTKTEDILGAGKVKLRESEEADIPQPPKGDRIVTVRNNKTGEEYKAAFGDKYWELGDKKIASIAKVREGNWSHGMLTADEVIIENGQPITPSLKFRETAEPPTPINTIDQTERAPIFEPAAPKGEASKVPQWFVNFMDRLGLVRNVKIDKTTGEITVDGKSVDGFALARKGLEAAINKVKLNRPDNLPHEMFHTFYDDMKQGKSNLGKKLAQKAEDVVTNNEEYKQWAARRKAKGQEDSAEEFLVEKVGTDFWKRVSEEKFGKEFLRDFWSFVKTRYSSKASLDDVVRVMGNKLRFDAPFSETAVGTGVTTTGVKRREDNIPLEKQSPEQAAKTIAKMSKDELENLEFDKNYRGYIIYEANKMVSKLPEGKLKKITDSNSNVLYSHADYIIKVEDESYLVTREEHPDFEDKFIYAWTKSSEPLKHNEIDTDSVQDLIDSIKNSKSSNVKFKESSNDFEPLYDETPLQSGTKSRFSFLRAMAPAFDKVKQHNTEAGEALHNFATRQDQLRGKYINEPLLKIREAGISSDVLHSTMEKMRSIFRGDTDANSVQFEGDELVAKDILQELFTGVRKQQNDVGLKIAGVRKGGKNEWYVPDMMSDETIRTLVKTPNSAEANIIKNEWAKYLMEQDSTITSQEAKKLIDNYTNALGNSKLTPTVKFGALDKAMGLGLPESMRETNGLKIVEKYGRRSAKRLATFMELESKPEIAAALGFKDQESGKIPTVEGVTNITNEPDVQQALKFVYDNFETGAGEYAQAVTRLVNNALLGAGTGLRDLASVPVNTAPYIGIRDLPVYLTALKDISKARKDSLLTNARSKNLDTLQWRDIQNPDEAVGWLNKIATALRVGQGREHLEQMSRIYTFAIGKQLAKDNYMRSLAGDTKAQQWLEKFGRLAEDLQTTENLDAQLNQIAKNFVDRVQGTYDGRGLPTGIMEGPFSPYLTLSKWGVEKANVIYQDVITPAIKDNNYTPLLMYTLGALMTGAGIRELNELISNKKDATPSVKEALAADNKPQLVASVINLLQQGSFAGIVSDALRMGTDTFIAGEKPRGISFPAADFAVTLNENLSDWSTAIKQGADKFETTLALIHKTLKDTVQNWRLVANNVLPEDKQAAERGDKFRDVRVFKKLRGDEVPPVGSFRTNPFEDKKIKQFKRTSDPKEAGKLAREIVQDLTVLAKSNRRKAMQKLKNIPRNNYQTFPNPDNDPQGALEYFNFLTKTQGREEAVNRFADFQRQNRLNREKSKMFRQQR